MSPARRHGLLRWAAAGRLTILASDPADLLDIADFSARDAAGGADLADVALVFAADRIGVYNVLTVDRKDFDRYARRWARSSSGFGSKVEFLLSI